MLARLSAIKTSAHPPDIGARKFPGRFNFSKNALRFGKRWAGINGHHSLIVTHICVEQLTRFRTTRAEDFIIGKQRLRREPFSFRNEHIATTVTGRRAFEYHCIEWVRVPNDCVGGHAEREIMRPKRDTGFAGVAGIATYRSHTRAPGFRVGLGGNGTTQ